MYMYFVYYYNSGIFDVLFFVRYNELVCVLVGYLGI